MPNHAIYAAVHEDDPAALSLLLAGIRDTKNMNPTPKDLLNYILRFGSLEILTVVLAQQQNLGLESTSLDLALWQAICQNRTPVAELLVLYGASPLAELNGSSLLAQALADPSISPKMIDVLFNGFTQQLQTSRLKAFHTLNYDVFVSKAYRLTTIKHNNSHHETLNSKPERQANRY